MIDAMEIVDSKITVSMFHFQSLFTWGGKRIFLAEYYLNENPSFNTNRDLLVLHYTIADYSTGI